MRYATKGGGPGVDVDMTPMIDVTFQLIIFFMLVINFGEGVRDERIRLPSSELAKPPEAPLTSPITLQLTAQGTVIVGGDIVPLEQVKPLLELEKQLMQARGDDFRAATVIIRGDREAKTGKVQELIRLCQQARFEKFVLRAKQQEVTLETDS